MKKKTTRRLLCLLMFVCVLFGVGLLLLGGGYFNFNAAAADSFSSFSFNAGDGPEKDAGILGLSQVDNDDDDDDDENIEDDDDDDDKKDILRDPNHAPNHEPHEPGYPVMDDKEAKTQTNKKQKKRRRRRIIELDVYYEALCPDSRNFIAQQLATLFSFASSSDKDGNDQLIPIKGGSHRRHNNAAAAAAAFLKLSMVPYGKANVRPICSHFFFCFCCFCFSFVCFLLNCEAGKA